MVRVRGSPGKNYSNGQQLISCASLAQLQPPRATLANPFVFRFTAQIHAAAVAAAAAAGGGGCSRGVAAGTAVDQLTSC